MRKFIFGVLLSTSLLASAVTNRQIDKATFTNGEKLSYRIAFSSALTGSLTAGKATLEVSPKRTNVKGHSAFHVIAKGETTGFVELFYKVNDKFESYIDVEDILPLIFVRRTRENKYKKDEIVHFNHDERTAESAKKTIKIPSNTQDLVSAFYFARTQNISNLNNGDSFDIPFYLDDTVYTTKVIFVGRQTIKTKMGKFNCLVFKPRVIKGKVFDEQYPATLWVTDDVNRLPVLVESKLRVGKARLELTAYEGLADDKNYFLSRK